MNWFNGVINIEDATVWASNTGYENTDIVTCGNEYWLLYHLATTTHLTITLKTGFLLLMV